MEGQGKGKPWGAATLEQTPQELEQFNARRSAVSVRMEELRAHDALRERLAAYAHEAWRQWAMVILPDAERAVVDHRKLRTVNRTGESHMEYGPCECRLCQRVARWRALLVPYADLPEAEKESDRAQADRILAILRGEG
jgi:hypothetical protein